MNKIRFLIFSLLLSALLFGCAKSPEAIPSVWIDSPIDGALISSGEIVTVLSHAYARQGVAEVVLSVNGVAYRRDAPSSVGAQYTQVSQDWQPAGDGTYAVQVQAYDVAGQASDTASITVRVGGTATAVVTPPLDSSEITPTPIVTVTPVIAVTPVITVTSPPAASTIQFYSYPPETPAGSCTTLYWNVENAQRVIFGGVDQPFSGSYETCPCENEQYMLTVVNLDGTEERRTVDINVTGSCVTELPPPPPQEPPPAPTPAVPADGLALSCRSSQTLAWLPVDDPDGISGYYVKLEKEVTPGNWQSAGGYGPISGKQVDVTVDCGIRYRWMVRAQDGAGNFSNWSAPSHFSINLN